MDHQDLIEALKGLTKEEAEEIQKALSAKPITKEMAEKSIEKKKLNYKSVDNGVEIKSAPILKKSESEDGSSSRESYRPTAKQLELINEMALEPQTKDSGYVFELISSTTDLDLSYERMAEQALKDMAKQTVGKPFFLDHSWNTKNTAGRLFKGQAKDGKLHQWAYVPDTEKNAQVIEDMFNGNLNRLSVGFSVDYADVECDLCHKSIFDYECEHYPGYPDSKGTIATCTIKRVKKFHEVSLVGVPCNSEAGLAKSYDEVKSEMQKDSEDNIKHVVKQVTESLNESADSFTKSIKAVGTIILEKSEDSTIPLGNNTIQDNTLVEEETKQEEQEAVAEEVVVDAPAAEEAPVVEEPKAEEAPAATEEPAKEEEKSQEPGITEVLVKLTETVEALKAEIIELNAKVDLAMTAPTEGMKAIVKAEVQEKKEEDSPAMALLKKFSIFDQENQE